MAVVFFMFNDYAVNWKCSDWLISSVWLVYSPQSSRNSDDSSYELFSSLLMTWRRSQRLMIDNMKPLIWYISRTHMPISISFFLNMIIQRVYLCYKSSIYYANIYLSFFCFRTMCNYVIWRFIKDLVVALPERFRDLETEYQTVYILTLLTHSLLCKYLSVVGYRSTIVFSYFGFLHQWNEPQDIVIKIVDMKFSAHDAFLDEPSSGDSQYRNIGKPNKSKVFGSNKSKGPKQDSQNCLRSPIPEGRRTLVN